MDTLQLKKISHSSVPKALELAERYRLLNEPEQAASICRDVLEVEPDNQVAGRTLLLAITDQFGRRRGMGLSVAQDVLMLLQNEYERAYYQGVMLERWARSKLAEGIPGAMVYDWLAQAMAAYERAESLRPENNDDAILRWNTCARLVNRLPELKPGEEHPELHFD